MIERDSPADESPGPPAARRIPAGADAPYRFTERELARLLVFRAAVDAGFYSDDPGAAAWHPRKAAGR